MTWCPQERREASTRTEHGAGEATEFLLGGFLKQTNKKKSFSFNLPKQSTSVHCTQK